MSPPDERSGPEGTTPQARSQRPDHHAEVDAILAPSADDSADGAALRDQGAALADENTCEEWKAAVDAAIAELVAAGVEFSLDDVRERLRDLDDPDHPNAWGARVLAWARAGEIERTGYAVSRRRAAHARVLSLWRRPA